MYVIVREHMLIKERGIYCHVFLFSINDNGGREEVMRKRFPQTCETEK